MHRQLFVRSALLVVLAGCDVGRGEDPSEERLGQPAQPEPPRREPPFGEETPADEAELPEGGEPTPSSESTTERP